MAQEQLPAGNHRRELLFNEAARKKSSSGRGTSLARDYHAKLVVLHVAEIPQGGLEVAVSFRWATANPGLCDKLELLRPRARSVPVEYRLVEGVAPAEQIVEAARQSGQRPARGAAALDVDGLRMKKGRRVGGSGTEGERVPHAIRRALRQ